MTIQEKIAVMQAFAIGKEIESRHLTNYEWRDATTPMWDWHSREYRVKRLPLEAWIVRWFGVGKDRMAVHTERRLAIEHADNLRSLPNVSDVRVIPMREVK